LFTLFLCRLGRIGLRDELIQPIDAGSDLRLFVAFGLESSRSCIEIVPGAAGQTFLEALPASSGLPLRASRAASASRGERLLVKAARSSPVAATCRRALVKESAARKKKISASTYFP
jgi:hypothetical protein